MDSTQFAALVDAAVTDTASLKSLMQIALGDGFMARLARKELNRIGIVVEMTSDFATQATGLR